MNNSSEMIDHYDSPLEKSKMSEDLSTSDMYSESGDSNETFNKRLSLDNEQIKNMKQFNTNSLRNFVQDNKNIEIVNKKIKKAPPLWHRIKPEYLATVDGLMTKFFDPDNFRLKSGEYMLKIKLVLTETGIWPYLPTILNRVASNFVQYATLVKLGLVHAALQLGPYLIDWSRESDLVNIRPIKSDRAMVVADIDKGLLYRGEDRSQIEKILRVLASRLVHWNVHRKFSFKRKNCQVFAQDCLNSLDLDYKFSTKIDEYIRFIKKVGFSTEKTFSNPYNESTKSILTHQQLDDYVNSILKNHPNFEYDYPNEWELLKSFDRAFWVGYVNINKPKKENKPCLNCPFSNPLLTGSFSSYNLNFSGDLIIPKKKKKAAKKNSN